MFSKLIKLKFHIFSILIFLKYKLFFGNTFKFGKRTSCRKYFNVYIEKGAKIKIGNDCFFNHGCSLNALDSIVIGDGCLFGENVKIYDHNHKFRDPNKRIKDQGFKTEKVTIGQHCWIGSNVVILKGTTIGNNCVIGAGCVVSGVIPSNCIVKINVKQDFVKMQQNIY